MSAAARVPSQWALTMVTLAVFYLYAVGVLLGGLLVQPGIADLTP